jgi:glycosyltransferase involved in cell wall biosynthesis
VRSNTGRRAKLGVETDGAGRGLRVCHLGKYYPPAHGGMETHVCGLAHAQAALGAEVHVVCVNHQDHAGRDVTFEAFARTPTVCEWDGPVRVTRVGRCASLARFDVCAALPGVLSRLQRLEVDVLHLHVPNPTMLVPLAMALPRTPLVITYHSDVIRQQRLAGLLRPLEDRVFRRAGMIVATSPTYAAGSKLLQAYNDKVSVLPFGIDLNAFMDPSPEVRQSSQDLHEAHGQPLWLAVGRLVYYKGLDVALKALAHVPGRLLVVGCGPLKGELRRLAESLGVADRVIWRPRLSDRELTAAYHAATALWFPSNARSEAFGLVQVEALASGCPVLNTAIPASGVAWVSRHEETGLTVPVNDPVALAAAARRLLTEPGLRDYLAVNARARAVAEFDHRVMAQRSLALYRGLESHRPHHRVGRRPVARVLQEAGQP